MSLPNLRFTDYLSHDPKLTERIRFQKPNARKREHQANERTFLAWLRTSVALIGFGFAIARFGLFLRQLRVAITHQEIPANPIFNSGEPGHQFGRFWYRSHCSRGLAVQPGLPTN